jgi:hypothetical protein
MDTRSTLRTLGQHFMDTRSTQDTRSTFMDTRSTQDTRSTFHEWTIGQPSGPFMEPSGSLGQPFMELSGSPGQPSGPLALPQDRCPLYRVFFIRGSPLLTHPQPPPPLLTHPQPPHYSNFVVWLPPACSANMTLIFLTNSNINL